MYWPHPLPSGFEHTYISDKSLIYMLQLLHVTLSREPQIKADVAHFLIYPCTLIFVVKIMNTLKYKENQECNIL